MQTPNDLCKRLDEFEKYLKNVQRRLEDYLKGAKNNSKRADINKVINEYGSIDWEFNKVKDLVNKFSLMINIESEYEDILVLMNIIYG
jgi:hypothetical protein